MGTLSQNQPTQLPPFATTRTENGVTEFRVHTNLSKWLAISLIAMLFLFIGTLILFVTLVQIHEAADSWPGWHIVTGEMACGLLLFLLFIFGLTCIAISATSGEITSDGKKLHLKDRTASYEIPISEIHSIRHIAYPGRRLEIDISAPPKKLFFRARKTAMEIQLPQGRIEFFQFWEEPKVGWLVQSTTHLLFPNTTPHPATVNHPLQNDTAVIAGRLYGNARRLLLWTASLLGIIATATSSWYAYQGLSSRHWPTTPGIVIHSNYEESQGDDHGKSYKAEIKYSYKLSGATYTNDDLGFERDPGDDIVKKLLLAHPDNSPITVYYNPSRPSNSIVIPGLGPMHWLLCGASIVPLLLVLAYGFQPNTAAQAALSARYKTWESQRTKKMDQLAATIRWSTPHDAWQDSIHQARRAALAMSARVLAITALSLWAAHHWMAQISSPDFPWFRVVEIMMAMACFYMIMFVSATFMNGRKPPSYALTAGGILVPSKDHPLIRWKQIASFSVQPHPRLPNRRQLTIHRTEGFGRIFTLPGGDMETSILSELSTRFPQGDPPPKSTSLTKLDWLIGFTLTVATIWVAGNYLGNHAHLHHGAPIIDEILLIGLIAGPGTWCAFTLWTRRAKTQLILFAITLNLFATMGALLSAIIHRLTHQS